MPLIESATLVLILTSHSTSFLITAEGVPRSAKGFSSIGVALASAAALASSSPWAISSSSSNLLISAAMDIGPGGSPIVVAT